MNCEDLLSSCEQVRKMSERIRYTMERSSFMTQDLDHLFNDLRFSIDYCAKYARQ